jgi:hypothetical protein
MTQSSIRKIFENFIIIAIVAVLVHTGLAELHYIFGWSMDTRSKLIIAGFCFDFLFTVEFFIRIALSKKERGLRHYFLFERGWVDFLASIPLLLLDSGPTLFHLLFPDLAAEGGVGGIFSSLKTVKAIRVTRILRLLRAVKILGKIQHADSAMATRHISTISTVSCVTVILVITIFGFFNFSSVDKFMETKTVEYKQILENSIDMAEKDKDPDTLKSELVKKYFRRSTSGIKTDIILLMWEGKDPHILVQNFKHQEILHTFMVRYDQSSGIYRFLDQFQTFSFSADEHPYKMIISNMIPLEFEARVNFVMFSIIVFLILGFMLVYTRHFVQTVSDPINVMRLGMEKADSNLEVLTLEQYEDDETYKLAEQYNEKWLPLKQKESSREEVSLDLSLDDFMGKKF